MLALFENTEEHWDFLEDDFYVCIMDFGSDYETAPDNLEQEFFDALKSSNSQVTKKSAV